MIFDRIRLYSLDTPYHMDEHMPQLHVPVHITDNRLQGGRHTTQGYKILCDTDRGYHTGK